RWSPNASMKVLLPTPGTPLTPIRAARPVCGSSSSRRRCAAFRWSARVLSTSVIAFASARRSPARTFSASAPGFPAGVPARRGGGGGWLGAGIRRRPSALADQPQALPCRGRDLRPRPEDGLHARLEELGVILRRDDAAHGDDDVAGAQ